MTTPPHCEQLHPADPPRFGEADLSNCEREQIHLAGAIQPHGALLVVTEPELVIVQASANAPAFLRLWGPLLGLPLSALGGNLATRVRSRLSEPLDILPVAVRCEVASLDVALDGSLHRPPGGGLVVGQAGQGRPVHRHPAGAGAQQGRGRAGIGAGRGRGGGGRLGGGRGRGRGRSGRCRWLQRAAGGQQQAGQGGGPG